MHFPNAGSVALLVLGAISSVVAHPVAQPSLDPHADLHTRGQLERRLSDDEFSKLAGFGLEHRQHIGKEGKAGVHFIAKACDTLCASGGSLN